MNSLKQPNNSMLNLPVALSLKILYLVLLLGRLLEWRLLLYHLSQNKCISTQQGSMEPWQMDGPVIKGFGRGSKVLGIPTANISTKGYSNLLSEHPSGVYFGWAGLSGRGIYKMVMSIGWNPYFNNPEMTIEPWLLHDFDEDLHLIVVGYIRPEANFASLESLVAKIHDDRRIAQRALELPIYSKSRDDPYLSNLSKSDCIRS